MTIKNTLLIVFVSTFLGCAGTLTESEYSHDLLGTVKLKVDRTESGCDVTLVPVTTPEPEDGTLPSGN